MQYHCYHGDKYVRKEDFKLRFAYIISVIINLFQIIIIILNFIIFILITFFIDKCKLLEILNHKSLIKLKLFSLKFNSVNTLWRRYLK